MLPGPATATRSMLSATTAPPLRSRSSLGPLVVHHQTFTTGAVALKPIAGHACRLRAIPANTETGPELDNFAAQQIAVSEAALPVAISSGANAGAPFNFYVNDVTFTGFSVWSAAGTPIHSLPSPYTNACGGPEAAPIDAAYDVGNFAVDCTGSLLSDDLGAFGGRSEVQIDGRNAYDPAAAQSLFTTGSPLSQNLLGFPKTLGDSVAWDPATGLISSHSTEPFVECDGTQRGEPTAATCPSFIDSGVELQRNITTSDGGRVVAMTDTWISTDGKAPRAGPSLRRRDRRRSRLRRTASRATSSRASPRSRHTPRGTHLPGPGSAPGSILVRTNVAAPDGDPSEAVGALTFGTAPSEFAFTANDDFEEHNVLVVPAGGSTTLSYVYSVGYSLADVTALALAAQDRFEPPSVVIAPPAGGTSVSTATTTLSGITSRRLRDQIAPRRRPDGSGRVERGLDRAGPAQPGHEHDHRARHRRRRRHRPGAGRGRLRPAPIPPTPAGSSALPGPADQGHEAARRREGAAPLPLQGRQDQEADVTRGTPRRVTSTSPRAGRTLRAGSKVELFVSKGR